MENETVTKKGNNIMLGIVLGFIVGGLTFGLGTYYIINNNIDQKKDNTKEEVNNESDADSDDATSNTNDTEVTKILSGEYSDSATTIALYKGEIYVSLDPCEVGNTSYTDYCNLVNNLAKSYKEYSFGNLNYEAIGIAKSYRYSNSLNTKFLGLKLNISNVKSVYPVMNGQTISQSKQGIALVLNDGSLAILSFENIVKNNLVPKTVEELKNIVKVENSVSTGGMDTVAVDNSGKQYNLYEYFE
jgi:hypothetical protein